MLAIAAVVLAICAALFVLRGCQMEVSSKSPESPVPEAVAGKDPPRQPPPVAPADTGPAPSKVAPQDSAQTSPVPSSWPRTSGSASPSSGTAAEALASAKASVTAAQRAAKRDPGEAFRLYAEAYAAASAHPDDAACAALAESIIPQLRTTADQANAAAGRVDGKTLIEE